MQWAPDRNAGFSRADFAQLYLPPLMDPVHGYQAVNVEAEQRDPSSFLHWLRRMLLVRHQYPQFATGSLEILPADNPSVIAYVRRSSVKDGPAAVQPELDSAADAARGPDFQVPPGEPEPTGTHTSVLCVSNLSRFAQPAELSLGRWRAARPSSCWGACRSRASQPIPTR